MKNKTKRVALSGVLSAVAILLMSVGSVINVLDMSAAYMAGFCVIIARIELDRPSAWGVYLVSGVLAFALLPDKFVAVAFLCYGGIYPIIKELCETIKLKWLMWIAKIVSSNILLTLMIWLGKYFTVATDDALGFDLVELSFKCSKASFFVKTSTFCRFKELLFGFELFFGVDPVFFENTAFGLRFVHQLCRACRFLVVAA